MMLQLLLRLRQISVHPQIYINARRKQSRHYKIDDWDTDSTKTVAIKRILSEEPGSHGYVMFCHFHEEITLLKGLLEKEPSVASVHTYHGGLNAKERSTTLQALQDARVTTSLELSATIQARFPSCPKLPDTLYDHIGSFLNLKRHNILLAQIQSAGTGLNLQHMDRVIFTTPWWTAALMDQAIARVLRMGQTQPVTVYHIGLEEDEEESLNIDNYIHTKVEIKRLLCKELLDAADHTITDKIKE
jgi:SNF2 family DNA or RNA helicase